MGNAIQYCFERYEKKYFLTPAQQEYLRCRMEPYVKVNDYGEYTTCNIYYDTDDWRLVRESIEKPAYKEKLRVRSYGVPAEGEKIFVELKKKCGGIVYKRRISTETYMVEPVSARAGTGWPLWTDRSGNRLVPKAPPNNAEGVYRLRPYSLCGDRRSESSDHI